MRSLLWIPLSLIIAALAMSVFCALAGWNLHPRELSAAAVVAFLAACAGLMPALLNQDSPVETLMQAGLAGSMLHMGLCLILGGLMWVGGLATAAVPFAAWLMLFYWVSLAAVATMFVRFIRRAARRPLHS